MKNKFVFLFLLFSIAEASANIKEKIIRNLENTNNLTFNFEQNIKGKTENGHCALSYPQKIFCKYNLKNGKILVSNGKSIVIKTNNSYYLYPIERTPLNLILDKKFLINRIENLDERILDDKFVNFKFFASLYIISEIPSLLSNKTIRTFLLGNSFSTFISNSLNGIEIENNG